MDELDQTECLVRKVNVDPRLQPLIDQATELVRTNPYRSVAPLLPLLLQLNNNPYSLKWSHFMMEPMFRMRNSPQRMLWRTARQISKSTSLAASQLMRASLQHNYNILTVMPLFEQVRKFSQNVVKPFIQNSTIKSMFSDPEGSDSVLQRNMGNGSVLFYSYSSGDPSRVRGVQASEISMDEVQDSDLGDLPVIEACMSASKFRISRYTGTPKTFDNTIHLLWEDSSQAIWHIPCQGTGCKHLNRCCATDGDLLAMIREEGMCCAKCKQPVNSRIGFYVHGFPERQLTFPGYHVSQPILPMHYEDKKNWKLLLNYMREKPTFSFYNEILGEPYDTGAKLITAEDLRNAAVVPPLETHEIPRGRYIAVGTGVDWGGRGKEKVSDSDDFISNTAIAVGGMLPDGSIEIPWIHKIPYTIDSSSESEIVINAAMSSGTYYIGMDYGGQGNVQETLLLSKGWPAERVVPFTYQVMAPTRPIVFYNPPQARGVRSSYTLDKPRSLLLLCEMIKRGFVKLPSGDKYLNDHLRDFLNIMEESIDNPRGSPRKLVKRMSRRTDDVVHAINFLVMSLLHSTQNWPQMAAAFVEKSD